MLSANLLCSVRGSLSFDDLRLLTIPGTFAITHDSEQRHSIASCCRKGSVAGAQITASAAGLSLQLKHAEVKLWLPQSPSVFVDHNCHDHERPAAKLTLLVLPEGSSPAALEQGLSVEQPADLYQLGDHSGPARLVAGTDARPVVTVIFLVLKQRSNQQRVEGHPDGPPPVRIAAEHARVRFRRQIGHAVLLPVHRD